MIKNLACYPELNIIIPEKSKLLYRVQIDQYKGKIPSDRYDDVAEFPLGGVLLYSEQIREFKEKLERLEGWLNEYPEYATPEFGVKLLDRFFNFFSEIEVYDALKQAGCSPERDVSLVDNKKNLDFRICPYGRDILIEVTTPRMDLETELMFGEEPNPAGFLDPNRGLERKGNNGPSREEVVVVNKIENQIRDVIKDSNCPVILVLNNAYARFQITGNYCDYSGSLSGIIYYDKGTSEFRPMPGCCLSNKEREFFSKLMGPSWAERFTGKF